MKHPKLDGAAPIRPSRHRRVRPAGPLVLAALALALAAFPAGATQPTTTRASVSSTGAQANAHSFIPSISADGQHVAFQSQASNLVPSDSNGVVDIFVRDRIAGTTERISVSSTGQQGNDESFAPSVSANGRYVAFESHAMNLVPMPPTACPNVFLRDRDADGDGSFSEPGNLQTTSLVSVNTSGGPGCGVTPSVSATGRYVVFASSFNLLPGGIPRPQDSDGDVYVRDMLTGTTTRASVSSTGMAGNGISDFPFGGPHISANGRYVTFMSHATNLVPGDTNTCGDNTTVGSCPDIFVRDLLAGTTTRVSVSSSGAQGDDISDSPSISGDGHVVAFFSYAFLVPGACCGIFVHDLITGTTTFASVTSDGLIAGDGANAAISADGRYVSFSTRYALAPCDSNGVADIVVHDMVTGATTLVSVADNGRQSNNVSVLSAISADGSFVAFESSASNLVTTGPAGIQSTDTNGAGDIFVREGANQPHPIGLLSGAIYRTDAGSATPLLRTMDCNVLWPQGL